MVCGQTQTTIPMPSAAAGERGQRFQRPSRDNAAAVVLFSAASCCWHAAGVDVAGAGTVVAVEVQQVQVVLGVGEGEVDGPHQCNSQTHRACHHQCSRQIRAVADGRFRLVGRPYIPPERPTFENLAWQMRKWTVRHCTPGGG